MSVDFAKEELGVIKYYMNDFHEIVKGCRAENKEIDDYLNKLLQKNELI